MKFLNKYVYITLVVFYSTCPLLLKAADVPAPPGGTDVPSPPTINPSGGASTVLKNPLGESSLIDFFQGLLAAVMVLAVPIIVFFIILAGFKYVTARGNVAQVEEAHKALLYAILGGVLILGAQALLVIIKSTVDSFGS